MLIELRFSHNKKCIIFIVYYTLLIYFRIPKMYNYFIIISKDFKA